MGKIIRKTLKKYLNTLSVLSIYTNDHNKNTCSAGFIHSLSDTEFCLQSISPNGENDGYEVRKIDNILRIDINGEYEEKILTFWKNRDKLREESEIKSVEDTSDLIVYLLQQAYDNKLIVELWLYGNDNSVTGHVLKLSDNELKISIHNDSGSADGTSIILLGEIESIEYNNLHCRKIQLLINNKNK